MFIRYKNSVCTQTRGPKAYPDGYSHLFREFTLCKIPWTEQIMVLRALDHGFGMISLPDIGPNSGLADAQERKTA